MIECGSSTIITKINGKEKKSTKKERKRGRRVIKKMNLMITIYWNSKHGPADLVEVSLVSVLF